ncbi:MAG: carbon monoxide dehydrogenase subunit G [Gammaproteobacteria bacterium]|nr:carbon monoxide dehydrogenase subunit G [Gammaproteobacteria bacterium]
MEEQGEFVIPASPQDVWDALQKPDILKECIDGCEEMTVTEEGIFACVVAIKVGPVKARFTGTVKMVEPKPPHSYVLEVSARGGGAGFGSGRAEVNLQEVPEGTTLSYVVKGTIGGKLAQIGTRLFQSFSRKMTRTFFDRFSQRWVR